MMKNMFYHCYNLISVPKITIATAFDVNFMFESCYSLEKILLNPEVTGWSGGNLSFTDCSLGHQALVDLLNSLPIITGAKLLTLTGNPGAAELTDEEKAVATGKNWTLTL